MTWVTVPVMYWIMLGSMNCTSDGADSWKCESAIMLQAPTQEECFDVGTEYIKLMKKRPGTFNARAKCAAVVADLQKQT